jgi:peptide deformylase
MAVRRICLFPEEVLSRPCKPVQHFDRHLKSLAGDLIDTLLASPGVGLAAPQIGVPAQVSVIDVSLGRSKKRGGTPRNHGRLVLVNPILVEGKGLQVPREGCLSVPDLLANVNRYQTVTVKALDLEGAPFVIHAEGFEALALQHEIDHLEGTLFLDRVSNLKTDLFRRKT